jgi:acetolactate decarboxylase
MKTRGIILIVIVLFTITSYSLLKEENDTLYYVSLNKAIHLGQYDGAMTAEALKAYGDFGLGSEEKLASELVILDGIVYRIPSDGKAALLSDDSRIPFAAVKFFKAEKERTIQQVPTLKKLEAVLDTVVFRNGFAAIRITGKFSSIEYRSFYKQEKPYKPVKDVPSTKFERTNIEGTLVGFYTPRSAEVLNSPSFHFHFIDKNKSTGGHLLECAVAEAEVEIDYATALHVLLPPQSFLEGIDLDKKK